MLEHEELSGEEEGTQLPLAEELVVEHRPGDVGVGLAEHDVC